MRVLMISWEYPPYVVGGLGKHVEELLPALAGGDLDLHVLTPRWRESADIEVVNGAVVHRIPLPAGGDSDFYTRAWQTNLALEQAAVALADQAGPFDLIHAHDWLTAFSACALKRAWRTPLLATIHATERGRGRGHLGSPLSHQINAVEWWLTFEAWRVICCSDYMAQEVRDYFDAPADKIDVIPNGVNTRCFERWQGVNLDAFRAMYALPGEKIIFYVGRVQYEKGIETLVRSVPLVLAQYPAAKFVIAGAGSDLERLRQLAWDLGVGHKVLFTGRIPDDDRDRLFLAADCAIFPSLYEPFGIVALEAMGAGCPVVVSAVGGLKEVVQHGETGLTCYPGDPASAAWAILQTLQHPEWTVQRVASARAKVLDLFNWDRIAGMTRQVYHRIVQERRRSDW
jgi:glycosyltransferase involved in cell wall biosynthesis